MPEGYLPELADLDPYYGKDGMQVDPVCLEDLTAMIDACNAAGARAYVISAYRSFEQQAQLFNGGKIHLQAGHADGHDIHKAEIGIHIFGKNVYDGQQIGRAHV